MHFAELICSFGFIDPSIHAFNHSYDVVALLWWVSLLLYTPLTGITHFNHSSLIRNRGIADERRMIKVSDVRERGWLLYAVAFFFKHIISIFVLFQ